MDRKNDHKRQEVSENNTEQIKLKTRSQKTDKEAHGILAFFGSLYWQ
jgi:hypothetical protein